MAAVTALGIGLSALAVVWRPRVFGVLALACLAAAHGAIARAQRLHPVEAGLLSEDPVSRTGVLLADASVVLAGVRLDLLVDGQRVRATVAGTLAAPVVAEWTRGRVVTAPIRLRHPEITRNPGSPAETWQRLTRRFDLVGSIKSAALVEVRRGSAADDAAARVRAHVRRSTGRWLAPLAPSTQAVVAAILIGDRAGLDDATIRRLQAAGTFHVIAISGGNVAMLTVACFLILRRLMRGDAGPTAITLAVVAAYGAIVSPDPSVIRAVLAAVLYLALRLVGLLPRPVTLLAVVAAMAAMLDPFTTIDVGAWLSFGATFGLIVVLPRLRAAAHRQAEAGLSRGRRLWQALCAAVLATAAAEIMILPVTAGVFNRVGVAGLVLNLVAIPAMAAVQFSGILLCILAPIWPQAAAVAAAVAHASTTVLLGSAGALDLAPWLSWRAPPGAIGWTLAYYGAVVVALWGAHPRLRRGAVATAAAVAVVLVSSPFVTWQRPPAGWLRVSMIDVGQGEAILVQMPGGRSLLMDAGGTPTGTFDVGGRVVMPAVWALGERRIDWVALSHGDLDHVGGARRVVEDLRPLEIWEGIPVGEDRALLELRSVAQARGVVWRRLLAGHEVDVGAVRLRVRHPRPPEWQRVRVRNDDSLVLDIRFGDVSVLLTGDAGAEFESTVTRPPWPEALPRIRILKAGHHGSRTSTGDRLLEVYDPRIALISAGAGNLFGHPAPSVLSRLQARDIHVFRTDRHGAVIVETDGRRVRVRAWTGRTLDVV